MSAVTATDLVKVYGTGPGAVRALDGVSATFDRGRFTAIMGASGSGKSTFMHCLAGLDTVTSGTVTVGGTELTGNLDSRSGAEVLGFLRDSVHRLGQTVVMVTHDPNAAGYADRTLVLADGRIVEDTSR